MGFDTIEINLVCMILLVSALASFWLRGLEMSSKMTIAAIACWTWRKSYQDMNTYSDSDGLSSALIIVLWASYELVMSKFNIKKYDVYMYTYRWIRGYYRYTKHLQVIYEGVVGSASTDALRPSSHPLTPLTQGVGWPSIGWVRWLGNQGPKGSLC